MIEKVISAGIVGAGGAGFPTHIKLQAKVDTYIANCAECEPLLRTDQEMISEYADKLVRGLEYAMELTSATNGFIAIKEKYKKPLDALSIALKGRKKNINITFLQDYYPAGDEFMVVYDVIKRIIPEGGLPLHINCVVNNAVTLMQICDAIETATPVTERPVTITGAVKRPVTVIWPIGTPVKVAIEFAGGANVKDYVILDGGPMMGKLIDENDVIKKTTSGIVVLPVDHPVAVSRTSALSRTLFVMKSACEQCMDCTQTCPRHLLGHSIQPHKIMRSVAWGKIEDITLAFLCSECGLCEWSCPQRLYPRRVNQEIKKQMINKGLKNLYNKKPEKTSDMREFRKVPLERILSRFDLLKYNLPAPLIKEIPKIDEVKIPLLQHVGVQAEPVVKVGDFVKKGQLIAKIPNGKLSANIQASIDGKIVEISTYIYIRC